MTTSQLLSESVDAALSRTRSVFQELMAHAASGAVLYGAGRLGRKTAAALKEAGIEPLAFADNDPGLVGSEVDGTGVLSPADAAARWRDSALFVVSTFRPDNGGVRARLEDLEALGCSRIASFLPLGWGLKGILPHFGADLPARILGHAGDLARIAGLLGDQQSRETFRAELEWRLHAQFRAVGAPAPDQYFPRDLVRPQPGEVFVDGGAYDGDTLRSCPWPLGKVLAAEPDPSTAARLRATGGPHVVVREALLGAEAGTARFEATGTMASRRSDAGALEVPVTTIDTLAEGERPTFIKLDVEGDELAALLGARRTLGRSRPVVAVCMYHRPEDLWTLPLFLHEALPGHGIYLRSHAADGFELVAYAVPPRRLAATP